MTFADWVDHWVSQIPPGQVVTYGQLAVWSGRPGAARMVGGLAHFGRPDLPWHRVVNQAGGLASGYPGGRREHYRRLKAEGVEFKISRPGFYQLDRKVYQWFPAQFRPKSF